MNKSLKNRMKKEHYKLVSVDLFSGPGGICTGYKWAGILPLVAVEWTHTTVETYSLSHDAEIFRLSEYIQFGEKYLDKFLKESTKTILIHGDINLVNNDLIKKFLFFRYGIDSNYETVDVVSGGAPCESFSLAGQRNEGDARDDLFSNILRIARAVKTKMIMFENVKGMFSKPRNGVKGAIFNDICDAFELKTKHPSYHLVSRDQSTILLKASDYGVPQSRERLILIAIRNDLKNVTFNYPEKTYGEGKQYPYMTSGEAISDLPAVESGEEKTKYSYPKKFSSKNQERFIKIVRGEYEDDEIHAIVPKHLVDKKLFDPKKINNQNGPGHVARKLELLALIPERGSMKSVFEELSSNGEIEKYRHLFPKTIYGSRNRRLLADEPSFTVTSHCLDEILHPTQNRAITVREAARLQSFPDWYQFAGPDVTFHSDKDEDKYEQIGDAVPPLLAYAIGKEIIKALPNHL
jgi:DNA (cytosine-5)-methyltransferase 1